MEKQDYLRIPSSPFMKFFKEVSGMKMYNRHGHSIAIWEAFALGCRNLEDCKNRGYFFQD